MDSRLKISGMMAITVIICWDWYYIFIMVFLCRGYVIASPPACGFDFFSFVWLGRSFGGFPAFISPRVTKFL
jgi:hypothetical protein